MGRAFESRKSLARHTLFYSQSPDCYRCQLGRFVSINCRLAKIVSLQFDKILTNFRAESF